VKPLSTRTLKAITAFFLVFGFALMFAGPGVIRRPPKMSRREYARRAAWYTGGLLVAIVGAGGGAVFLIRRARAEYREQSIRNMNDLLEAARQDHLKTKKVEDGDVA
jgi:hypothetical protein